VAGFPNPLPDTLHLLFSWFVCVHVRLWSCVRVLAWLRVPVLVALLVALSSRSTPVQWFRAHTDLRMCKIHCTIVILPSDMRVSQESDWNTAESARVFSIVTLVVRVFGRTSVLRQSELRTDVR